MVCGTGPVVVNSRWFESAWASAMRQVETLRII
jgi:hypothetical protein